MYLRICALFVILLCDGHMSLTWKPTKQLQILFNHLEATKLFNDFVKKYHKEYKSSYEFEKRLKIFRENIADISRRNMRSESAVFGVTPFADLCIKEMGNILARGCFKTARSPTKVLGSYHLSPLTDRHVNEWDWRKHHIVTGVKNQGECGASWAFAAVAAIESRHAIRHKRVRNLSVQQFLDCTGNSDCAGGDANDALYLNTINFGGVLSEKRRPYLGIKNKCNITGVKQSVKLGGVSPYSGGEDELAKVISCRGPVVASVEVTPSFLTYKGGVATAEDMECDGSNMYQCVAIIGYGIEKDKMPYWIIKNSYGKDWGESGYIRLVRGQNACGIADNIVEPFIN